MGAAILIVEDDLRFRRFIKLSLKEEGYTFFEAGSVEEGQTLLNEHPDIKVIMLDLSLPSGNGTDLLRWMKSHAPDCRVIILTAHDELLAAEVAKEFKVFAYQMKAEVKAAPHAIQSIRFAVEQALNDIDRALLEKKTHAHLEIQSHINANEPLDTVCDEICKAVLALTGGYTCHLRLVNLKTGTLDLIAASGATPGVEKVLGERRYAEDFYPGNYSEVRVLKPIVHNDLQNEPSFRAIKETRLQESAPAGTAQEFWENVQSAYVVPIWTGLFGIEFDAMFTVTSTAKSFFSDVKRRNLIDEFGTQLTLAITKGQQSAKRYEMSYKMGTLSGMFAEISDKFEGADALEQIFEVVSENIAEVIKPEVTSIFLFNEGTRRLEKVANYSGTRKLKDAAETYEPGESLTGRVFRSGKPIRTSRLQVDGELDFRHEEKNLDSVLSRRIEHYLSVPISFGRQTMGVIRLINHKSAYYEESGGRGRHALLRTGFSEDSQIILELIASYLAVSLRNAELFNKLNWEVDRLQTLSTVARTIGSRSDMDIDELLSLVVSKTAEVMNAEICLLFLRDEHEDIITLRQAYGMPFIEGAFYRLGEGRTGMTAVTGNSILQQAADAYLGKYDETIINFLRSRGDGSRDIKSLMAVPIFAEGDRNVIGVLKVINKIGERFQFDEDHLNLFETFANHIGIALAMAERSLALSQLVGAVAHEINNSSGLTPAAVEVIRSKLRSVEDSSDRQVISGMLDLLQASAKQTVVFAKDLLGFSSRRIMSKEAVDVNELIHDAITQTSPDMRPIGNAEHVTLKMEYSDGPLVCNVYRVPFMHIIRNIVLNAYQAMQQQEQGSLVVRTSLDHAGQTACIAITDTGVGIKKEDLPKIFRPDFSTKPGGNGIGLWIVRLYVNRMGGTISVESEPGRGTTFTLQFPVVESRD